MGAIQRSRILRTSYVNQAHNPSPSLFLAGIIVLFVLCHMGEMIVSCYEIRQRLAQTEEETERLGGDIDFPQWVRNLIVVNHILIVANSSLNFAIYCKVRTLQRLRWKRQEVTLDPCPISASML